MSRATELLQSVFGFDSFRQGQQEIVDAVIAGENVLAIMPTGGGKSLCFQLPALVCDGLTVVISPLIALMRDQVRGLVQAGVNAGALTSSNTPEENLKISEELAQGLLKILYIAPERIGGALIQTLRRSNVALIAVDEAHCVSQWGHDFRPDYLRIGELRSALNVPIAAFTATADTETQADIIARLFVGKPPKVFLRGFDRPNLFLSFAVKDSPRKQIIDFAQQNRGKSGIVYCGTRAKTENLAAGLREAGFNAAHYHGAMDPIARKEVEERFAGDDTMIVVATVAFGMGVDKPDIRWVAHADLPKSIEAYYQEIGRAGRDGAPAVTLTLFGAEDIRLRRSQIDEGLAPHERKLADHGRLNALLGLADAIDCRRRVLLGYFGEAEIKCGNCDLCLTPPDTYDATDPVRMALSAVLRTDESFGVNHLIDILVGNSTDKVLARGHQDLPTFGIGKQISRTEWQGIFRQMMGRDLVRPDPERHGALRMTQTARPILRGEETITLAKGALRKAAVQTSIRTLVSEDDAPLLSALKAKRRALADAANVPAYIIFNDATLIEMAQKRPQSLDDMMHISGVGAKKLESYGNEFLSVIIGEAEHMHPSRRKIAGSNQADLYDLLLEAQARLIRGEDGTQKPLSCSASTLAKVVRMRPKDYSGIEKVLGAKHAERFGIVFLDLLATAS